MSYCKRKYNKTLAVLDLMLLLFPYLVLFVLVGFIGQSCMAAIDKHQEHYELSPADRAAVVASWKR